MDVDVDVDVDIYMCVAIYTSLFSEMSVLQIYSLYEPPLAAISTNEKKKYCGIVCCTQYYYYTLARGLRKKFIIEPYENKVE